MLNRANERSQGQKVSLFFGFFKENTDEIKKNKEQESALKELEDKLKKTASNAAANAKKTMARVGARPPSGFSTHRCCPGLRRQQLCLCCCAVTWAKAASSSRRSALGATW